MAVSRRLCSLFTQDKENTQGQSIFNVFLVQVLMELGQVQEKLGCIQNMTGNWSFNRMGNAQAKRGPAFPKELCGFLARLILGHLSQFLNEHFEARHSGTRLWSPACWEAEARSLEPRNLTPAGATSQSLSRVNK